VDFGIYDVIDDGESIYSKNSGEGNEKKDVKGVEDLGIYGNVVYESGILKAIWGVPVNEVIK
jgi:hypothetical protein